ncbi:hypothetical protein L1F30_01250 [Simiduia sp. 21SJ11W-1]|uniref:hypothetical protein n=1 Tax=Simiduia sp. 21SJ11W-1 TaxID=2909669 RepID=UPI00209ED468|nr:hypothetical protein [Simiduia sp. 21SJ11W-1]UTA48182.1 hypothetical protein L1F30_01250 [Simiduia sp. 21SJ11W-1]
MQRIFIAGLALMLAACASEPKQTPPLKKEQADLSAFSVISVTDPAFKPEPGNTISWVSDVIFVGQDDAQDDPDMLEFVKASVSENLSVKGYRMGEGMNADYRVIALVQVGDEKLSDEMRELFRLYPSLGRDSQLHKGMLIVAIARPGSVEALWRGAIKVFLDDHHVLTPEQRLLRLRMAVNKVLASMPKAR